MVSMFLTFESPLGMAFSMPLGMLIIASSLYCVQSAPVYRRVSLMATGQFSSINTIFSFWGMGLLYFFLVINLMALVPGSFSLSSLGVITLLGGLVFWLSNFLFCLKNKFFFNVAHFLPSSTPSFLIPLLVWIELVSWVARPLALGIRLMANITAGHLLLHLLAGGVSFLSSMGIVVVIGLVGFFFMVLLEIAVAFIQAYVFTLLLSLYIHEGMSF